MSTVFAKFDAGREWVMRFIKVPLTAHRPQDCTVEFVQRQSGGAFLEVGTVVAECLRNNKGVQVSIVLPNGYLFPTGRVAPRETWFPMLKAHIRSWLAMTPHGRIVRIVNEGARALEKQFETGHLKEDTYRKALARLEEFRASAVGELPSRLSENDLLAAFYNWVTEVSAQTQLSQQDIIAIIGCALRKGKKVEVPDLSEDILSKDFRRYLDI